MAPISFGRSISFPLSSPARSTARRHVRSISLPCRSHPLLAHLQSHVAAVRAWAADPTAAAPSAGLAHIDALHGALGELVDVMLPPAEAQSERLLDALVVLADAHRGFQEALLALKADVADLQAALRRRDAARLASALRSQRKNHKEIARLAAKCARLVIINGGRTTTTATAEEAVAASAAASAAVFSAAASMSAASVSSSSSSKKTSSAFAAFTKLKDTSDTAEMAPEKLEELAQCIDDCENATDKVFRSIVRTRVSLLNIRTPAI